MNIEESSWSLPFQMAARVGKLFHVHFGDNNRLPPGKGMINFAAIVEILKSLDYQGFLSAELLSIPDPDTAARQTLETMHSLLRA
jgi:sugar phosphate isomerase/epimerase